jgi:hypothetical protein
MQAMLAPARRARRQPAAPAARVFSQRGFRLDAAGRSRRLNGLKAAPALADSVHANRMLATGSLHGFREFFSHCSCLNWSDYENLLTMQAMLAPGRLRAAPAGCPDGSRVLGRRGFRLDAVRSRRPNSLKATPALADSEHTNRMLAIGSCTNCARGFGVARFPREARSPAGVGAGRFPGWNCPYCKPGGGWNH